MLAWWVGELAVYFAERLSMTINGTTAYSPGSRLRNKKRGINCYELDVRNASRYLYKKTEKKKALAAKPRVTRALRVNSLHFSLSTTQR